MTLQLPFVGNSWSLWIPQGDDGGLNIVSGTRKIASDIISVLLVRPGEDAIHYNYGLAPDLFEPLSGYDPQYWVYKARTTIINWVPGIIPDLLFVDIPQVPDPENRLRAYITFTPKAKPDRQILTFGWYEYTGAIWNREYDTFLNDVQLNNERFVGFK